MNMTISDELLAAYAEGKVTKEERNQVRQYLAENPQELESVMMMIDEDYELTIDNKNSQTVQTDIPRGVIPNIAAAVASPLPFSGLCCSAAAFASDNIRKKIIMAESNKSPKDSFDMRLNDFMDDLGI